MWCFGNCARAGFYLPVADPRVESCIYLTSGIGKAEERKEVRGLKDVIQEETLQECKLAGQEEIFIPAHLKEGMLSILPPFHSSSFPFLLWHDQGVKLQGH